jgi:hypothetical protein
MRGQVWYLRVLGGPANDADTAVLVSARLGARKAVNT